MSNGNEPAYPIDAVVKAPGVVERYSSPGLTKREVFAMAAMQGYLANADAAWLPSLEQKAAGIEWTDLLATDCAKAADALLAELEKPR